MNSTNQSCWFPVDKAAAIGLAHPSFPRGCRRLPRSRRREGGYALLFVLLMTAVVAISLGVSLPRAAMQAQRVREERLIYRGEQYKRAVQLYFRKYKKYPASMDDLEETNGERFLRRRYKDPITGKDEWRLVHMGSDGRFSDSLVHDQEEEEETQAAGAGGIQASAPIGSAAAQATPQGFVAADGRFRGAERARAVRQSAGPEAPGQPAPAAGYFTQGQPDAAASGGPSQVDPNDPYAVVGTDNRIEQQGQPNQPQAGQYPGYSRMRPGQIPPAAQQPAAGFGVPNQQAPGQVQPGNVPQYRIGNPTPAGPAGMQQAVQNQPGVRPQALGAQGVGNQAARIISDLLTRPRPGGMAGLVGGGTTATTQQAAFTGGIAGVASEAEDRGVKVYQGYEQYNQWEFVYDYRQDASFAGMAVGPQQAGAGGQALPQGQPGLSNTGVLSVTPGSTGVGVPAAPQGPYQQGYPAPGFGSPVPPSTFGQPVPSPTSSPGGQPGQQPEIDPFTGLPRQRPADADGPDGKQRAPGVPGVIPGSPESQQPQPGQPNIRGFPPGMFPFPGQPGSQPQQQPQQR